MTDVEVPLWELSQFDGAISPAGEESAVGVQVELRHPLAQVLEEGRPGVFPGQVVNQVVDGEGPDLEGDNSGSK